MKEWTRVSQEEIKKGLEIKNLKKGELQIMLAQSLVKLDKIREYINKENYKDESICVLDGIPILEILRGNNNEE